MNPAHSAARRLAAATELPSAVVGFDGFIDEIIRVVDRRHDMTPTGFAPIRTIPEFAARAAAAAGKSTNMELVVQETRWGGNGPLMAGALASLGSRVTYIGAVGNGDRAQELDPRYQELAHRCEQVVPVAPAAHTDALEFDDGKIMLGKPANVQMVTWELLMARLGEAELIRRFADARIIGMVNWTMMAGVEGIWEGLITHVLPRLSAGTPRQVFIDLADPAKRTDADIRRAVSILARMNRIVPVTLGLNLAEADRLVSAFGVAGAHRRTGVGAEVEKMAASLLGATGLHGVVIHPREGAGASIAGASPQTAWVDGPFTPTPVLSTGAGDHFNAGFALGQALNMTIAECLATACAVSGVYVRDARSPSKQRLIEFMRAQ